MAAALVEPALACETVEYSRTSAGLERDALQFFDQEKLIYEGLILGQHDPQDGGHFLVLRSYKGAAKPFDIVDLPGGSSCYGKVTSFSIGFWADFRTIPISFDGLVSEYYVEVWKRHGRVKQSDFPLTLLILATLVVLATVVLIIVRWFRTGKRRNLLAVRGNRE